MFIIIKSFKELKNLIDKEIDELIEKYSLDEYNELNNLEILSSDCNKLIRYLDSENNKYIDSQKIDESIDILSDSFNEVDSELNKDYLRKVEMANSSYKSMLRKFNLEKDEIYNSLKLNNNEFLGKIKNVNTVHNKELVSESLKIIGEKSKPLIDITKQKIMDKDFNRVERKIKTYYEGINYKDKITLLARDYEVDCIGLNGITNELNRVKYDKSVNIADRKDLEKDKNKLEKKIKGFEDIYKNKSKDEYVEPIKPFSFKVDFITSLSYTFGGLTPFVPLIILILFVIIYINFVAVNVTTFGIVAFPIFSSLVYVLFKGFFDEHFEDSQRKMVILGIVGIVSVSTMFMPISYYIVSFFSFVGLYALTLIYISSKDFNKNTKKLLNETRLDIVYIYNEADKLLMPLISKLSTTRNGDDNYAKLKSLILYIQFGYVSVYKKACNKYYGIDNVEQLNIEKLKSRNSSNNNSGVSEMFGNNDGDGLGDMFGGSDISNGFGNDDTFGDMFGGGSDSFGIDDEFGIDVNEEVVYEDYSDEEFEIKELFNEVFKFEKVDNKGEIIKTFDYVRPKIIEDEDTIIYVYKIKGLTYKSILNKQAELESVFGKEIFKIHDKYDNKIGEVGIEFIKNPLPLMIPFKDSPSYTDDSRVWLGKSVRNYIHWDLDVTPHGMIVGGTGGGKSVTMNYLIQQWILKKDILFFVDFKGGTEFGIYEELGFVVAQDIDTYLDLLKKIHDEILVSRLALMKEYKVKHIDKLNVLLEKEGKQPLKRILLILDEYADVKSRESESKEMKEKVAQIESYFGRILAKSRSSRINVVVGTQRPDAKTFGSGAFRDNILFRMVGKMASSSGSEMSLETDSAFTKIPDNDEKRGMFVVKGSNENGEVIIRVPLLEEDSYDDLFNNEFEKMNIADYINMEGFINHENGLTYEKTISLNKKNNKSEDDEELFDDLNFL